MCKTVCVIHYDVIIIVHTVLSIGIWWLALVYNKSICTFSPFFYPSLQKGDKLALMVTPEKELIFSLNGRKIGTIGASTSKAVYAFIDLYSGIHGDSVRLIPDLREVRKWKQTEPL